MNGNIIYYSPPPLGDFSEYTYIKEKTFLKIEWYSCDDFMSSAYSLSLSLFFGAPCNFTGNVRVIEL